MRRDPNTSAARSQTIRRRLGNVTLTGQGLGLGLGTSLFPVGAMEIKARISAHNVIQEGPTAEVARATCMLQIWSSIHVDLILQALRAIKDW